MALTAQGDGLAVVDAGGDVDRDGPLAAHLALAAAVGAGVLHQLAGAAAAAAGAGGSHDAEGRPLLDAHLAGAAAVGTGLRARAGLAARAAALLAVLDAGDRDLLAAAEGRLLKGDGKAHAQTLALLGGVAAARSAAAEAEAAAENVAQDVAQVAEIAEAAEAAAAEAAVGVEGRVPVLVVAGLLVRVGQHLVRLADLLEALLACLVARMQIRVILLGQLAVGLLYFIVSGALAQSEHLIIIAFFRHFYSLRNAVIANLLARVRNNE